MNCMWRWQGLYGASRQLAMAKTTSCARAEPSEILPDRAANLYGRLLVRALKTGTPTAKQAASRIVGGVDFTNPSCASHFDEVVSHLERLAVSPAYLITEIEMQMVTV